MGSERCIRDSYESREPLVAYIAGVRFFHTTLHCMGGQLLELAGDEAHMVTWAMLAHHGRTDDGAVIEFHNSGSCYVDVLTRKGGRWLVRERGGPPAWPAGGAPVPDTDDPALRWLIDRALVRDLLVQWALGMDERDAARVGACVAADFREDGAVDAETFASRAVALRRLHSATHFLGVPAIDLAGDVHRGAVPEEDAGGIHDVDVSVREQATANMGWAGVLEAFEHGGQPPRLTELPRPSGGKFEGG